MQQLTMMSVLGPLISGYHPCIVIFLDVNRIFLLHCTTIDALSRLLMSFEIPISAEKKRLRMNILRRADFTQYWWLFAV